MITVHHLENSRSQKVIWLLEELQLDYEIKQYKRNSKTNLAPPELKAIHPLGKSPIVVDGENTLAETGAIIEYFVDKCNSLKPGGETAELLCYRYWLHAAEGSIMPLLVMKFIFQYINTKSPFFLRPITKGIANQVTQSYIAPGLNNIFDLMEMELNKSLWFAGNEFTAVDIQMSSPVEAAIAQEVLPEKCQKVREFAARIKERPAYKKSLEKGGGFVSSKF